MTDVESHRFANGLAVILRQTEWTLAGLNKTLLGTQQGVSVFSFGFSGIRPGHQPLLTALRSVGIPADNKPLKQGAVSGNLPTDAVYLIVGRKPDL
jgi:hypothetical protein